MRLARLNLAMIAVCLLISYTNCSNQGFRSALQAESTIGFVPSDVVDSADYAGKNVLPVTIGTCSYINAPCVSVTVCVPGTANCKVIDKILLDTGSTGLRVFKQVLGVSLPTLKDSAGKNIAECLSYIGGSSDWGPVARADIQLGGEKAKNVPMQIIDATFASVPSDCKNLDADPNEVGFNGILGVGLFVQDCGDACADQADLNLYYACSGTTCTSTKLALAEQITNPVAMMPKDNNGVLLKFPTVAGTGAASLTGTLILGIGTQSNNTLTNATVLNTDSYGNFKTEFDGKSYTNAFIDSGSNAMFFPAPTNLPKCSATGEAKDFYCPTSTRTFSATMKAGTGNASKMVSFTVGNAETMLTPTSTNMVLPDLGGDMDGNMDWGLPFFLGRTVATAIEGKSTNLGTGPFWAF